MPVVESSFDAFAYSRLAALQVYGNLFRHRQRLRTRTESWYDGRRDVLASTDAALDFLSDLNRRFDGDWNHAIAAHNSGGGRVSRCYPQEQEAG
ncbi:transglycosylase SLT domain-containing protein [Vibrio lentus]|nr:transglycosylase SLT domain-containing protein [Vibrio lentus]